ncbi:SDR family oxidoreductase [Streptomyces sp. 7R007]
MGLAGQRVVVIGGTTGIGLGVAEAAAREGAEVVVASRSKESVEGALARLPQGAEGHLLDVSEETRVRDFFARLGAFDHLVFTAGEPLRPKPLPEADLAQARGFLDTRLWGTYAAVKYGAPLIREGGSIVLTSGTVARRPLPGASAVAGVGGALESLTRALALDLAPLRVNAVVPGTVRSALFRDLPEAEREALYASAARRLPVGRIAEPADVAEAYLYLMRCGFSTGSVVLVDGGAVLV